MDKEEMKINRTRIDGGSVERMWDGRVMSVGDRENIKVKKFSMLAPLAR
jgi:hypothetical protein